MPRSANSRWNGIFWPEGSSDEPGGAQGDNSQLASRALSAGLFICRRMGSHTQVANSTGGIMNLSEYKDYLTGAITVEANFTSDETARRAFETLVEHVRGQCQTKLA